MYYCLREDSLLRGWEKLPTGIVRKLAGTVLFLPPDLYAKIRDFGWMLFEGSPFFNDGEEQIMKQLVEAGFADLCEAPRGLTEEQKYRFFPNRFIRAVHWAITGKCNCRCRHCYMSAPTGNAGEYTHEECMQIIEQMEAAGIQEVSLTGGEPLIRKDFSEIAERLTSAGIRINTIMSNGLLVDETILSFLSGLGQKPEFNMSFDGIGCHDWLRGVDGAERKVLHAFELCAKHGFPTGSEYCLHRGNTGALRESVKLLGSLGVESLKVAGLSLQGEARTISSYILPKEEEFQFYLDYIPQYYEDGEPLDLMLSGMFWAARNKKVRIPFEKFSEERDCGNYCLCGHARNKMYLTQDGYIVPCIPLGSIENGRDHFPTIRKVPFSQALNDSFYMSFIDTRLDAYFKKHPTCNSCEYRNRCAGGCRGNCGNAVDLMAKDEITCAFFRGGWYDKTIKLLGIIINNPGNER